MKIVSTSYLKTPEYSKPDEWLQRIRGYTGILEELAKAHEVISFERINYEGSYDQNSVHYYFISSQQKLNRFPIRMHRMIRKLTPDVVFVNGFMFPLQIIQLRMQLGAQVKILLFHRADKPFKGYKKLLQRIADRCVDAYLFTSAEFGKDWIDSRQINSPNKIYEVIQASSPFRPLEKQAARSQLAIDGSPVFLWVGRLDRNKDPITVLKAFIQFLDRRPSAKLYMVYQSDELLPAISQMIVEAKASHAIVLVGRKPHEELEGWYSSADFIISGSHYEGSGVAVSEAMSCGCIPIVTNIPSFRAMTGEHCGFLYQPGNDTALLHLLKQASSMNIEEERRKVLMQFQTELSFEAIAKKIEQIIQKGKNG